LAVATENFALIAVAKCRYFTTRCQLYRR